jgi:hypothetical protein
MKNGITTIRMLDGMKTIGCSSSGVIQKPCVSVIELLKINFRLVSRYGQVVFQTLKILDIIWGLGH